MAPQQPLQDLPSIGSSRITSTVKIHALKPQRSTLHRFMGSMLSKITSVKNSCHKTCFRGIGLPSGKLTVCYWKWSFSSWIFPIKKMVIFHIAMLNYHRVHDLELTYYKEATVHFTWKKKSLGDSLTDIRAFELPSIGRLTYMNL